MILAGSGMIVSGAAMYAAVQYYYPDGVSVSIKPTDDNNNNSSNAQQGDGKANSAESGAIKLDGPAGLDIIDETAALIIDGVEQVPTGNSTVPHFPKSIRLPRSVESTASRPTEGRQVGDEIKDSEGAMEEYKLLGLGVRTVSILSIQVYVVGMYVAVSDLAALQQRLVRQGATPPTSAPINDSAIAATSLVPGEREELKQLLLDPGKGEEVWDHLIRQQGVRTAFRIVPTRNTDFLHLRDGWVRSITGRAQKANARVKELAKAAAASGTSGGGGDDVSSVPAVPESEFADDSFGVAVNDFKALLGGGVRKNVPKGQTLLLLRDGAGALEMLYQPGDAKSFTWLGEVQDERIGRLLWEGYLSGKTVASEGARKSIVDGMMSIAARPVGTVDQRVL